MKLKSLLLTFLLLICCSAHADWYLRGTQNNWRATPMKFIGNNTMEIKYVVFNRDGSLKFDRYGNWYENYGAGGFNGGNIPIKAGTWNIRFYTDTHDWKFIRVKNKNILRELLEDCDEQDANQECDSNR